MRRAGAGRQLLDGCIGAPAVCQVPQHDLHPCPFVSVPPLVIFYGPSPQLGLATAPAPGEGQGPLCHGAMDQPCDGFVMLFMLRRLVGFMHVDLSIATPLAGKGGVLASLMHAQLRLQPVGHVCNG